MDSGRRLLGGRSTRWSDEQAASAYSRGQWTRLTLADALGAAAEQTPQRVLLVDGSARVDCKTLHARATRLAQAMLARAPVGSVVSFMLPNWHEASVLYLAATLAGMVVNPILPSLRDRELTFILKDVETRLIFVPSALRQQDYAAMLARVVKQLSTPPEVVVLRGEARGHTSWDELHEESRAPQTLPAIEADSVGLVLYTPGMQARY
jgi:non-ribosomal peptide synthetase component E (peptide arylation enzyme)